MFLLLLGTLTVFISTSTGGASARYFKALGLEFTGIVIKKSVLTNGSGILRVKIITDVMQRVAQDAGKRLLLLQKIPFPGNQRV